MQGSYFLLLGFCTWTLLLLLGIGANRISLILSGKKRIDSFAPSGEKGLKFGHRIGRAHANCCENLPMVIGVILYAAMTNQLAVINGLAWVFLAARMLQSITHMISVTPGAVTIRFSFYLVQCALLIYWLYQLWMQAL